MGLSGIKKDGSDVDVVMDVDAALGMQMAISLVIRVLVRDVTERKKDRADEDRFRFVHLPSTQDAYSRFDGLYR